MTETFIFYYHTDGVAGRVLNSTLSSAHTITTHGTKEYAPEPGSGSPAVFQGGSGNDVITGTASVNAIHGNDGNDWLFGKFDDDAFYIDVGKGNDRIDGDSPAAITAIIPKM